MHYAGAIADELLREMGGRMWRNREAACLGLADLLQASVCLPAMLRYSCAGIAALSCSSRIGPASVISQQVVDG